MPRRTSRFYPFLLITSAVIITVIVLFGILPFFVTTSVNPNMTEDDEMANIATIDHQHFGNAFYTLPSIDESLPHREYKIIEDSLKRIEDAIRMENEGGHYSGMSSFGIGGLYAYSSGRQTTPSSEFKTTIDSLDKLTLQMQALKDADSIKQMQAQIDEILKSSRKTVVVAHEAATDLFYWGFDGFKPDYDIKFFIENGSYNLAYIKWDSVIKRKGHATNKYGHYERRPIKVRYASENNRILIPITGSQYMVGKVIMHVIFALTIVFAIWVFVWMPVRMLLRISKGNAFNTANIRTLRFISFCVLALTLYSIFMPYILRFIFRNTIPPEFELSSLSNSILEHIYSFLISLAIFIISKAFQRGLQLQQEQSLTI
ncbi:MAG: DUF2975 domain-containing protein [Chitinophagaceae bacterium]